MNKEELSGITEVITNSTEIEKIKTMVAKYIRAPLNVPTPPEKVKKRPDGLDYVEGSWLDKAFKESSPLYNYELLHKSELDGWIDIVVKLTDRITGNSELGAGSARVQVRRNTGAPNYENILDKGNNIASALTKAIKNAQSRFGHAADVYHKREEAPTDDERKIYDTLLKSIKSISSTRASIFADQWKQLGTGYSEYLDKWNVYVKRNSGIKASSDKESNKNIVKI